MEKKIDSKTIFNGKVLTFIVDDVELDNSIKAKMFVSVCTMLIIFLMMINLKLKN